MARHKRSVFLCKVFADSGNSFPYFFLPSTVIKMTQKSANVENCPLLTLSLLFHYVSVSPD